MKKKEEEENLVRIKSQEKKEACKWNSKLTWFVTYQNLVASPCPTWT